MLYVTTFWGGCHVVKLDQYYRFWLKKENRGKHCTTLEVAERQYGGRIGTMRRIIIIICLCPTDL